LGYDYEKGDHEEQDRDNKGFIPFPGHVLTNVLAQFVAPPKAVDSQGHPEPGAFSRGGDQREPADQGEEKGHLGLAQ
jgi:hypothetical protein